ncbi:Glutamyl-tRNA(Gln) amidotransferase subunit E [Candidatus Lokiarchaeum ossiferum]|uniref:Glutamyl-tRNA(Gln) amidotransferase subunit E n=1 Tax=Candidatus Lokiarchaeum ossiferum TaxID=2951803 RepID=A0ABY6HQY4_9ARCH|nr:Glutamyl-tRNA(Gln) amidotransferase subunit E [Candidatus Lokiarchaeum sp. B-35]
MNVLNYEELGLRIGIEIHQQLASAKKLFCNCPNQLQGTRVPDFELLRKQRPVLGEEGKFDKGMLVEFLKKGSVVYEGYYDSTCTYELDETPPFACNPECIDIVLEIAHLFKMQIVREMHVCRKNYVDGSVPGGFQRTMELGQNGKLLLQNGKEIGIENIFLEEDAARRSKTEGKTSYFRIDRLGIPLTEITTTPDIHDPFEAKDAAYRIGLLLRSTNKVKRVLGSTRQDINISIKNGERIEIKGVQKLDWIPELVDFECHRQLKLIEIKNILAKSSVSVNDIERNPVDVTSIFTETPCKFVNAGIKKGLKFTGMKLKGFNSIFGIEVFPNIRFGTEVAGKVKVLTGLKGLIHSDEDLIGKYKFSEEEITQVKKKLQVEDSDLFILLLAKGQALDTALDVIIGRTKAAFIGVPEETRQAQDDGTHLFLRELGGEKRLYPDTDSPAISLSEERINRIKESLGPYPWDIIPVYAKKYELDPTIVEDLIMHGKLGVFEKLIPIMPENPTLVVRTITDMVKVLHRDQKNIENLTDHHFIELISGVKNGEVAKEAMEPILEIWTQYPALDLAKAKDRAGISTFDLTKLDSIIKEIIQKNLELITSRGRGAMGPLMGDLMKAVGRGAVDGKILSSKLNQALTPYFSSKPTKNARKSETKSSKSQKKGGKN